MGTRNNPGVNDCYDRALPDEPRFTLLARDPDFRRLLQEWAGKREADVLCGERPEKDGVLVAEARLLALQGSKWRREHMGEWRKPPPPVPEEDGSFLLGVDDAKKMPLSQIALLRFHMGRFFPPAAETNPTNIQDWWIGFIYGMSRRIRLPLP